MNIMRYFSKTVYMHFIFYFYSIGIHNQATYLNYLKTDFSMDKLIIRKMS